MESKVYIDPYPKTMKMLGLERININCGNNTSIVTPANIAKDMVKILPDDVFIPESKFLDICCKSGIFLTSIRERLMNSKKMIESFPDDKERYKYITNNQLYGISPNGQCHMYSVRAVYGTVRVDNPHILCFGVFDQYKAACLNNNHKILIEEMKKEFGQMKFDVVIGNPPYNKGMDLDFVDLGFSICNKYCLMIVPAKWQTAEADQKVASKMTYGKFREKLVPHMSHVVFYPDTHDVFLISQVDGITYFLLEKDIIIEQCIIENRCSMQKYFNSLKRRSICTGESLHNIGNEIIEYLTKYPKFKFGTVKGRYQVWINSKIALGGNDAQNNVHILSENTGSCQCIGKCRIIDTNDAISMASKIVDSNLAFASDNIQDCNSFESWIKTKFIRFFVLINISKLNNVICDTCFRFVPAPPSGKFDHIYTDEELYRAFNLPQKYIDIIEAVIKERK